MRKRDHQFIDSIRNIHAGRRCFILGTGPSLDKADISPLAAEVTFGVNYLSQYKRLGFMPTFWAAAEIDDLVDIDHQLVLLERRLSKRLVPEGQPVPPDLKVVPRAKFFSHEISINALFDPPAFDDWTWIYRDVYWNFEKGRFNGFGDELEWVATNYNVVWDCAFPMAIWMGMREIYLLGCDNNEEPHAGDISGGVRGTVRNRPSQAAAHTRSGRGLQEVMPLFRDNGVTLVDLSVGGSLPLPKSTLAEVLAS